MSAERPILFSAPMVRALLADTKTQTRRVVKLRGAEVIEERPRNDPDDNVLSTESWPWSPQHDGWVSCPYGSPGGRLWVKETFAFLQPTDDAATASEHRVRVVQRPEDGERVALWYRADGEMPLVEQLWADDDGIRWRPSIYMPRWASRIALEVTAVRVERLQAITATDAIAEGIERGPEPSAGMKVSAGWKDYSRPNLESVGGPVSSYRSLWESINGDGSWEANPWVWVVSFKRVTP